MEWPDALAFTMCLLVVCVCARSCYVADNHQKEIEAQQTTERVRACLEHGGSWHDRDCIAPAAPR